MSDFYLGVLMESPIQYHAPLFSFLAAERRLKLKVLYMSRRGLEPFYHKKWKVTFHWDIPLLEGYDAVFMHNRSPLAHTTGFWSALNPELPGILARERFDALWVHGYQYAMCWLAFFACKRTGTPLFLRGEGEDLLPRHPAKARVRDELLAQLYARLDAALYIGECNRRHYLRHGVSPDRLFYVPYSVDNVRFDAALPDRVRFRRDMRRQLGLNERTVVFLLASKHRPDRYPSDVVEAFCQVPESLDAALVLLGDGPLRPSLEAYVREHAGRRRIHFLGLQPQSLYPSFLAMADVLVHASSEPWGCAINEGIAASLAIISSDRVLGWHDMVHDGRNGLVYPFHNTDSLARSIIALAGDAGTVFKMRQASRELSETMDFRTCRDGVLAALDRYSRARASVRAPARYPVES